MLLVTTSLLAGTRTPGALNTHCHPACSVAHVAKMKNLRVLDYGPNGTDRRTDGTISYSSPMTMGVGPGGRGHRSAKKIGVGHGTLIWMPPPPKKKNLLVVCIIYIVI